MQESSYLKRQTSFWNPFLVRNIIPLQNLVIEKQGQWREKVVLGEIVFSLFN